MPNKDPSELVCKGVVIGTPRTYGNRRSEDIWRNAIVAGQWEGATPLQTICTPLHLDFEFRINPQSVSYNKNVSSNGPDLDTMVIGALAGLTDSRNPLRPTLRLLGHAGLCKCVTASKQIVECDTLSGFSLHVRQGSTMQFDKSVMVDPLSFFVERQSLRSDRRRAVQQAAEKANVNGFRAPKNSRIKITLAFAEGVTRNPLSADWLEAVIDGLGASHVNSERFFDGPPTQQFGYDDSVVYRLICAQIHDLPPELGLHVSVKNL